MSRSPGRRRRQLTPEEKWEVFLEVTSQQLTQADAARKWGVDVSVVIKLRRLAEDACLAAFAACKPARIASPEQAQIEALRGDNARLSEALKELAVELTLTRGYAGKGALGLNGGPLPARLAGEVKEGFLKIVDEAVAAGWAHTRACALPGLSDVRVHRWRARLRAHGTVEDRAPGGNPVHRLLGWEEQAILDLIEAWGPVDRSHRKLAHGGSYTGTVFVSPSTVLRVSEKHQVRLPGEPPRPPQRARCRRSPGSATASGSGTRRTANAPDASPTPHRRCGHALLDRLPAHHREDLDPGAGAVPRRARRPGCSTGRVASCSGPMAARSRACVANTTPLGCTPASATSPPNDEHRVRGPAIRRARAQGLKRARQDRIEHHRKHRPRSCR